ncbi:hypothetical protein HWV62_3058 [Athelia sp. TMB]|nr:hypothetical protein HWV62_3058 [Athelia sp. TMB]
MAVLRDAARLGIMEPFARWKLRRDLVYTRSLRAKKLANGNGHTNGYANGHVNGNGNGHSNGHTNGAANGHSNGELDTSSQHVLERKEDRDMHRKVLRFAEQAWSVIYYVATWSFGMYVYLNLPATIYDRSPMWSSYPDIPIAGPVKFYYLLQTAFYLHQVLILNAEAKRKDHVQMMTHHVITIALIGASYYSNFTRVGCMLLFLMDWCDIWLPMAWFWMICRVAFRVVMGENAEDERSEDGSEDQTVAAKKDQ